MLTAAKLQLFFEPCNYFTQKNKYFFLFLQKVQKFIKKTPEWMSFCVPSLHIA